MLKFESKSKTLKRIKIRFNFIYDNVFDDKLNNFCDHEDELYFIYTTILVIVNLGLSCISES